MSAKTTSLTHESHDTVTHTSGTDSASDKCETTTSSWWGGCEDSGLAIAVIALVILWTLACWCGMSWLCSDKDDSRKGGKDCDDGCNTQYLGVGFVWFLILVIFLLCAYKYKWHAVAGLLVFFLLILLAVMWCGC